MFPGSCIRDMDQYFMFFFFYQITLYCVDIPFFVILSSMDSELFRPVGYYE